MQRWLKRLIWIAPLAGGFSIADAASPRVTVNENTNLTYQLDCLSQVIRCTDDNMTIVVARDEGMLLDRWYQLRQKPTSMTALGTARGELPSTADLAAVSSRHLGPREVTGDHRLDALTEADIRQHFQERHQQRWLQQDATHLYRMRASLHTLASEPTLKSFWHALADLYGNPQTALPAIQLIATRTSSAGSLATLDANTLFIESPRNETARNRLPVIAHELVHFWQQQSSEAHQQRLLNAFLASESVCALPAFHLFDEVVATAVGNGALELTLLHPTVFAQYELLPLSFYDHPDIDQLAKAILPEALNYLQAQQSLDAAFVHRYIATMEAAMPSRCATLATHMRGMQLGTTSSTLMSVAPEIQQQWQGALLMQQVAGDPPPFAALSTVVLATWERLPSVPMTLPTTTAFEDARRKRATVIVVEPGKRQNQTYWVIGANERETVKALSRLLATEARPSTGLLSAESLVPD